MQETLARADGEGRVAAARGVVGVVVDGYPSSRTSP